MVFLGGQLGAEKRPLWSVFGVGKKKGTMEGGKRVALVTPGAYGQERLP